MISSIRSFCPPFSSTQFIASIKAHPIYALGVGILILGACYALKAWANRPSVKSERFSLLLVGNNKIFLNKGNIDRLAVAKSKLECLDGYDPSIEEAKVFGECRCILGLIQEDGKLDLQAQLHPDTDVKVIEYFKEISKETSEFKQVLSALKGMAKKIEVTKLCEAMNVFQDFAKEVLMLEAK